MSKKETNEYILGTHSEELHRLGIQHQVWAEEAAIGWGKAKFNAGQTILDLGCGPGFCTTELAYIAGKNGNVIGIDKSAVYINYLENIARDHGLNISTQSVDFDSMVLEDSTIDGVYSRWALAWISNPEEIIQKIHQAMKQGGTFVAHEYFNWMTLMSEPQTPDFKKGIEAAFQSFADMHGDINIGRQLPRLFSQNGFEIVSQRPMIKMAKATDFTWNWPKSFFKIYLPSLVEKGYLSEKEVKDALKELSNLEKTPNSTICCPMMTEVIARKI